MTKRTLAELAIDALVPSKNQPRLAMSDEVIASARQAIKANGGVYPEDMAITVRPRDDGRYEIIAGHHRAMAADEEKCKTLWAFVCLMDDREALLKLASTNSQSKLTPLEHGRHAAKLKDQYGIAIADYGKAVGIATTQAYGNYWAWQVLVKHGGTKGRFAKLPARVLSELYAMNEEGREELMEGLLGAEMPTNYAVQCIKNVKNGLPLKEAILGMADHLHARRVQKAPRDVVDPSAMPPAPRKGTFGRRPDTTIRHEVHDPQHAPPSVKKLQRDKTRQASLAASTAAAVIAHHQQDYIRTVLYTAALYQARCEALEELCGDRFAKMQASRKNQFLDRVTDRQREILEHWTTELNTKPWDETQEET